jgi:phospholipid/cholesterol/gamma-HCH transport system substrate-binding protein
MSTPVFVDGFRVGLVREIAYDYANTGRISVEISLERSMRITRGSYISIEKTLMSGGELHIHLNTYVTEYLESGESLEGRMSGDMMSTLQEQIIPQFAQLVPKLDSILSGISRVVTHPALVSSLEHLELTAASLERSSRKLDRLLEGELPVIAANLSVTSANLAHLSGNLRDLELSSSVESFNQTLSNLNAVTARLQSSDNSMGLLLTDTMLYRRLNLTLSEISNLLIDMREHPNRYVHFSLF